MGCFDRTLVGTYIIIQLNTAFENENVSLYRDDGLGIFRNLSGQEIEKKNNCACVSRIWVIRNNQS